MLKVQIVVGDGLSSSAIEANVKDFLPALKQGLKMFDWTLVRYLFIKHASGCSYGPNAERADWSRSYLYASR